MRADDYQRQILTAFERFNVESERLVQHIEQVTDHTVKAAFDSLAKCVLHLNEATQLHYLADRMPDA